MANIINLTSTELADDCYVYKHSTQCSLCAMTAEVVRAHPFDRPVYWVNVIEQRPLSNWIADTCGVRHQSPQLIKISGGQVERHWSHFDIDPRNLS